MQNVNLIMGPLATTPLSFLRGPAILMGQLAGHLQTLSQGQQDLGSGIFWEKLEGLY